MWNVVHTLPGRGRKVALTTRHDHSKIKANPTVAARRVELEVVEDFCAEPLEEVAARRLPSLWNVVHTLPGRGRKVALTTRHDHSKIKANPTVAARRVELEVVEDFCAEPSRARRCPRKAVPL